MSGLRVADKVILEAMLGMSGGYVLDFTNDSFAEFFRDLNIEIFDSERFPGFGDSKANRLRAFWRSGSDAEVAASLRALVDYIQAKRATGFLSYEINDENMALMRGLADGLASDHQVEGLAPSSVSFTTEATVTDSRIQIEIHEDIYAHIKRYLATEDYFHAVEESYKIVREALREKTGSEKATDAFKPENQSALFGHEPASPAEKDFFDGVKYLNMAIQFLRNEKSHTLATLLERNLALHYISLASLAYDLITRYVSDDVVETIERSVLAERQSYSASRFYRALESGTWMTSFNLPPEWESRAVRRVLQRKWVKEVDFTRSWDHSNVVLMRLQLVADELSSVDIDALIDLPVVDNSGYHQEAGLLSFLEFMQFKHAAKVSPKVSAWIVAHRRGT